MYVYYKCICISNSFIKKIELQQLVIIQNYLDLDNSR